MGGWVGGWGRARRGKGEGGLRRVCLLSVLRPTPSLPPSCSLHKCNHALTHSLTYPIARSLTRTEKWPHSFTHPLTHALTHSLTHTLKNAHPLLDTKHQQVFITNSRAHTDSRAAHNNIQASARARTHTHTHTSAHTHNHTNARAHTHTQTNTHTHVHIHGTRGGPTAAECM